MEYELVGTIIGLAIYNQVVLDVHLPRVVYKKLLPNYKDDLTFQDFKETFPALAKGLERLLEFEGDVEESLCLTFSVSVLLEDLWWLAFSLSHGAKSFRMLHPL